MLDSSKRYWHVDPVNLNIRPCRIHEVLDEDEQVVTVQHPYVNMTGNISWFTHCVNSNDLFERMEDAQIKLHEECNKHVQNIKAIS